MADEPVVPDVAQEVPAEAPEPTVDSSTPEPDKPDPGFEAVKAELAKARNEAAGFRVKLKELEPLAKKQLEADEAKKDVVQKAEERAQAAEKAYEDQVTLNTQLNLAVQYHIEPDDIELIGSGTPEEMEVRAKRIAALTVAAAKAGPPPTDRPIEGLRPGASPEPGNPPDDSYPESWKPDYLRDNEKRSFHGQ